MERLKSLILLLLVKSGTANKAGRLILRSNHDTDQTISIMTECKCNKGDEMSFSIAANLLPNIVSEAENFETTKIEFSGSASGCSKMGGNIKVEDGEAQITFKIDPNCGVLMNDDQLPIYIAEEFSGRKLDANIHLSYSDELSEKNLLQARLSCVCQDDTVERNPCQNDKFVLESSFDCRDSLQGNDANSNVQGECLFDESKLADFRQCGFDYAVDDVSGVVVLSGSTSLFPNPHGLFDCPFIEDKENYLHIGVNFPYRVKMAVGATTTDIPMDDLKEYSCLKPARWTDWMSWSECSSSCGAAERTRRRYCDNGAVGLPGCTADSDGLLDEHAESCGNQVPCPTVLKCPTGTRKEVLSRTEGCECEDKPSLKLLVPLSISQTRGQDIKNGLVFTHGPDMEFTIADFYYDHVSSQGNFKPLTLDDSADFLFKDYSPEVENENRISNLFWKAQIGERSWVMETVYPINFDDLRLHGEKDRTSEEEFAFLTEILDGKYSLVFVASQLVEEDTVFVSSFVINVIKDDWSFETVSLRSKLSDAEHWCGGQHAMPSDKVPPPGSAATCHSRFSDCIDCDQAPPKTDTDDTCPKRPLCDPYDKSVNPCGLGLQGATIGSVSFDFDDCGECANCNQLQVSCSNGQAEYKSIPCDRDCKTCTAEKYGQPPFPQWTQWLECTKTCGGGITTRSRDMIDPAESKELIANVDCHVDFEAFNNNLEEERDCNINCCGCCSAAVEDVCPDSVVLDCPAFPDCTSCDQTHAHTCKYTKLGENCQRQCNKSRVCQEHCCDPKDLVEVPGSRRCVSAQSCLIGKEHFENESVCPSIKNWSQPAIGGQCMTDPGNSCPVETCSKPVGDESLYNCVGISDKFNAECKEVNREFVIVSAHCSLKNSADASKFCSEYEKTLPCVGPACDPGVERSCCRFTCEETSLCQVLRKCFDQNGVAFEDGSKGNCCTGVEQCTTEQAKQCKPCAHNLAEPPECLSSSNEIYCKDQQCKFPTYKCPQCQSAVCRQTNGEDIEIFTIDDNFLESVYFNLPKELYTDDLRFILGEAGNFATDGCFHTFHRNQEKNALLISYKRSDLHKCSGVTRADDSEFKAKIYVDKETIKSNEVSTHTVFAEIDCSLAAVNVSSQALLALPRFDPVHFTDVIPGDVKITFDISTDPEFKTVMQESEKKNAVLVGELLYARIKSSQDFRITRCSMYDRNDDHKKYDLLVDGCPTDEHFAKTFHFEYLKSTEAFTKIFKWQNFIFRDGADQQVLVYHCEVAPCYQNCDQVCSLDGNRKRRQAQNSTLSFTPTKVNFFLEVYETRKALEEALRQRKTEYVQEMMITLTTSILILGFLAAFGAYWFAGWSRGNNSVKNGEKSRIFSQDMFRAQLRTLLESKSGRRSNQSSPPSYSAAQTLAFQQAVDHALDDPDFVTNSLTPKLALRN